jgi:hypothetical protein
MQKRQYNILMWAQTNLWNKLDFSLGFPLYNEKFNHYNKRCPYMPSDFIGFSMNSLFVVNGTSEEAVNSLV